MSPSHHWHHWLWNKLINNKNDQPYKKNNQSCKFLSLHLYYLTCQEPFTNQHTTKIPEIINKHSLTINCQKKSNFLPPYFFYYAINLNKIPLNEIIYQFKTRNIKYQAWYHKLSYTYKHHNKVAMTTRASNME